MSDLTDLRDVLEQWQDEAARDGRTAAADAHHEAIVWIDRRTGGIAADDPFAWPTEATA